MPTIKEKVYFNFDGKSSRDFNVFHVNFDSGMLEEIFVANREIIETKVRGNNKPHFIGIESKPLEFSLNLAFDGYYTDQLIDNVINWLFVDYYKPLYFEGAENKIFYCMPVDDSSIIHNGLNQGYIQLQMRCDSSYVYSPVFLSEKYDLSNGQTKIIELYNRGHTIIYPEISIEKIEDGNVTFIHRTNGGNIFEIRDLINGEDIYINCEKEIIETNLIGVSRYGNVIGEYFPLLKGKNTLEVNGKCKIQFRYQYKYRF